MMREIPPTAGLPLVAADFFGREPGQSLEQALATLVGVRHVSLASSGTAAFIVALTALKSSSGRQSVIVPAYTCPLVALAVAQAGLRLKVCDVRPDGLGFDDRRLGSLIDSDTLCIVPTHLFGFAVDVEPAIALARAGGAYVVEDAAQSLGARAHGVQCGTGGDIGFFSLSAGKGLTMYEGGFAASNDDGLSAALADAMAKLSRPGGFDEFWKCLQLTGYWLLYNPCGLSLAYGMPLRRHLRAGDEVRAAGDLFPPETAVYRPGPFRAAVAARAMARLEKALAGNFLRASGRVALMSEIDGVAVLTDRQGTRGSWPYITLLLSCPQAAARILDRLWGAGLGVSRLFVRALPDYDYLRAIVGDADVPNARSLAARCLLVSNSAFMSDADFERVASVVRAEAARKD